MELGRRDALRWMVLGGAAALAGCGGGGESRTSQLASVSLQDVQGRMTVGESFVPRVVLYGFGDATKPPAVITLKPAPTIRWTIDGEGLQQQGERFIAISPGRAAITVAVVTEDGKEHGASAYVVIQSPPGQPMPGLLHPLPEPYYRGRLIGTNQNGDAVVLADPGTGAQQLFSLPESKMSLFLDPERDRLWLLGKDNRTLWRMSLRDGVARPYLQLPDSENTHAVYPLGEERLLVRAGNSLALYENGAPFGMSVETSNLVAPVWQGDAAVYVAGKEFIDNTLSYYDVGVNGLEKRWQAPWRQQQFRVQGERLIEADGTVRNARTLAVERQLSVPYSPFVEPRLSPSGKHVLFSHYDGLLQILVYNTATDQLLTDVRYFVSSSVVSLPEAFFVDDHTLGYVEAGGAVVVLPGLF